VKQKKGTQLFEREGVKYLSRNPILSYLTTPGAYHNLLPLLRVADTKYGLTVNDPLQDVNKAHMYITRIALMLFLSLSGLGHTLRPLLRGPRAPGDINQRNESGILGIFIIYLRGLNF